MTTYQYRILRYSTGLSVEKWAQSIFISESLHKKLCSGEKPVSRATEAYLRTLNEYWKTTSKIDELNELIDKAGVRYQLDQIST